MQDYFLPGYICQACGNGLVENEEVCDDGTSSQEMDAHHVSQRQGMCVTTSPLSVIRCMCVEMGSSLLILESLRCVTMAIMRVAMDAPVTVSRLKKALLAMWKETVSGWQALPLIVWGTHQLMFQRCR